MGLSFGIITIPPLTQLCVDIYGWQGTALLLSGANLHLIVCGALLRPFSLQGERKILEANDRCQDAMPRQYNSNSNARENSLTSKLVYYLDLYLFIDFEFISMLVYNCGSGYCMTGWLIYLVPHAVELGIQPYYASLLATYGGIGNLLACIVYPVSKLIISDKMTLYISSILVALAFAIDPVISRYYSYQGLASLAVIFVFATRFGFNGCV